MFKGDTQKHLKNRSFRLFDKENSCSFILDEYLGKWHHLSGKGQRAPRKIHQDYLTKGQS